MSKESRLDLSDRKRSEIESWLISRFDGFESQRTPLDDEVRNEIDTYNAKDDEIDSLPFWHEKVKEPYMYTIGQTVTARLIESLFGMMNYLRIFIDDPAFDEKLRKAIENFLQDELDKLRIRYRARDFLEIALSSRVGWLHLRPVPIEKNPNRPKEATFDFDILRFYDVWLDFTVTDITQTDYFIRKVKYYNDVKYNTKIYENLDEMTMNSHYDYLGNDKDDVKRRDEYLAMLGKDVSNFYYGDHNGQAKVELLEWYGRYDINDVDEAEKNDPDYEPNYVECIFVLGNRRTLIRAEKNVIPTKRKRLLFPIRPIRQPNALIGKSIPQLLKGQAHDLNMIKSLTMQNYKLNVQLLFKYNRGALVNLEELFAGGGNGIGLDDMNDVQTFNIPNVINEGIVMQRQVYQSMQQTIGATDMVMGTTAARGLADTASGTRGIIEQANFKFQMMAENCASDLREFIKYLLLLHMHYNPEVTVLKDVQLGKLLNDKSIEELEDEHFLDITLKDLSARRDVEQNQWANMVGILFPMLQQIGGNPRELMRQLMDVFQMNNKEKMLIPEDPAQFAQMLANDENMMNQVMELVAQMKAQQGQPAGEAPAEAVPGGSAVERAANENLQT